jgi:hypothetical protein
MEYRTTPAMGSSANWPKNNITRGSLMAAAGEGGTELDPLVS